MKKFMGVDLIQSLETVLHQNTGFYQSDFDIDKQIFAKAVSEPKDRDKTFLWLSRPCGTHCFKEYEVFLKGFPAYSVWQFFGNRNHNGILAFVVKVTHNDGEQCLYHMMPFKEYSFSEIKGRYGIYVFVAKEENRNRKIRKIQK